MRSLGLSILVCALSACASAKSPDAPTPVHDVVSGAARIRGGGMRMDVLVGEAFHQPVLKGNGKTAKPATVVTP